jgi:hypothetical protein
VRGVQSADVRGLLGRSSRFPAWQATDSPLQDLQRLAKTQLTCVSRSAMGYLKPALVGLVGGLLLVAAVLSVELISSWSRHPRLRIAPTWRQVRTSALVPHNSAAWRCRSRLRSVSPS